LSGSKKPVEVSSTGCSRPILAGKQQRETELKRILMAAALGGIVLTSGCSTIINGKVQSISVNSNVKDAEVKVDDAIVGRTPFTGYVRRNGGAKLTLSKVGYESKTVTLDTAIEPFFWGNIIFGFGSFFSSTTDASTGSMYKYDPATINVDLVPVAAGK
jgi:hypothetical protein